METLQLLQKECDGVSGAQRLLVSNPEMVRDRDAEMTCLRSRSACWRMDVEGLAFAAGGRRNRPITSARLPTVSPRSLSTKAAYSFATSSSAEWMDRRTRPQIYITARIACAIATGRSPEASTPVAILSPNPLALPGTSQTRPWPSSIALF